jgi:preprotein translocase subunit SecG
MEMIVLIVHILVAAGIVGLVLIQHGKGADVGAAFGSGSAGSVFGSAGSANFMSRLTGILALVFFLTSMGLTWLSGKRGVDKGVMAVPAATQKAPGAVDVPTAPTVTVVPVAKGDKGEKTEKTAPAAPAEGAKAADAPKDAPK